MGESRSLAARMEPAPGSAGSPASRRGFVPPDAIRARFASAMSAMYRDEVPLYATLLELVDEVNARALDEAGPRSPLPAAERARLGVERHGAIRVGSARELGMLRRMFAILGMHPVGYYDLSVAGVPVHSTALRPVRAEALQRNPFRIFTSLLRLEAIDDPLLREQAARLLAQREIFTPLAVRLTEEFEADGGLDEQQAESFVRELLQTFRWHATATVSRETYRRMHDAHRLVADVVCFRGPHINHLSPRTLDIDAVQARMPGRGLASKQIIEGPPRRKVPILLRQTSFKALAERVVFDSGAGPQGEHTARFGEVEQRGIALTPKGRALYDQLLREAGDASPATSAAAYMSRLERAFRAFPDDLDSLREQALGYFRYTVVPGRTGGAASAATLDALLRDGVVQANPITYEDFLPVSAAGIFQSNLGDASRRAGRGDDARADFERALGCPVLDLFALYEAEQADSLEACRRALRRAP